MADASALAGLLDRAMNVFSLASTLAWDFEKDFKSQGPVVMIRDPSPQQRHKEKIKEFIAAVLDLRDAIQHPADGFAAVADQLREVGKLSRQITKLDGLDLLELWPNLNQVGHDGYQVAKAARKAARLDDPFAFVDESDAIETDPAFALVKPPEDTLAETENNSPTQTNAKRSTERGEGRAKLISALTKHHKYADDGCLNPEPVGNNELARMARVSPSTASAFFEREFKGHGKYRATCADERQLLTSLKLLNKEFSPHHLIGAKPPGEA